MKTEQIEISLILPDVVTDNPLYTDTRYNDKIR